MFIGTSVRSRRSRRNFFATRGRVSLVLAATMAMSGITLAAVSTPAEAASSSISLDKTSPASVLVGEPITFSVKASNPAGGGDADFQYNLSFRDVLPAGVTYVSTSAPDGAGDPEQIAELNGSNQPTGRTILIWSNLADLPDGSDVTLTYKVQPNATTYPVGSTVTNSATGYVSSNERKLAKFDSKGALLPSPDNTTVSQAGDTATTSITALELEKSEPSSEHELTRGVHERPTVYTLKVINNGKAATNNITVVDYLPAGLEFLGCGAVDNSAPGTTEYPGSGRLTVVPAIPSCVTPSSVTTVNSNLPTGYPAGVYTRVEWTLPSSLTAGGTYTIKYAAGIPLRENVMPAAGFTSTANLDNNTGASTRETATEIGYTNRAVASGRYQGLNNQVQTNTLVTAEDKVTVTSEDVAVAKSVDSDNFTQGGEAEYELLIRSSEYTDGGNVVMVDTLPDGLCPSDAPASSYTSAALAQTGGDCAPTSDNAAIDKVDYVSGAFVITFKEFDISAANATRTVTYKARMRSAYSSGEETSAGDSYVNSVALTGKTTPIGGTSESGTLNVKDDSQATLTSSAPVLDKRILPNTPATYTCGDNNWASWKDSQTATGDAGFTTGSRVCFQVRVTFPAGSSTRLPVITDYLPDNLTYEPNSFQLVSGVNTASYTVNPTTQNALNAAFAANGTASLRPGTDIGTKRYVAKGQVFAFKLSATVNGNDKTTNDVQGNLAKLRWTNKGGQVSSLRDKADFKVPPVPPVSVDKRVAKAPYTAYANSQNVVQGDVVRYSVQFTNNGTIPIGDVEVWDKLPLPYKCADVSSITSSGSCTDSVPAGGQSIIRATLSSTLAPNATGGFTYNVTIPVGTSVGTTYTNTAYIRTFTTATNLGGVTDSHFPKNNVDPTVPTADQDAPEAKDTASVVLPKVGLTKTNVTSVDQTTTDKNGVHDAVPGETITYTIRAKVPAHTTVYNGVLTDPMTPGVTFVSATAGYSATGANPASDALPTGSVFTSTTGELKLPTTWDNTTGTDQVFEVTVTAKLAPTHTGTTVLTNTATFNSKATLGGTAVTAVKATSDVTPIHPAPTLTKALSSPPVQNSTPAIGDTREFVLTASNATGKPTLFDTVVVDCVPAGLVVTALGSGATQAASAPADACATVSGTGTVITWNVGSIAAGESPTLKYTVQVGNAAAGGQDYVNIAKLTGSSLSGGGNNPANEEVLTDTDTSTLTAPPATITKAITDDTLIVGELAKYTVKATLPAHINFYDASIIDTLPDGLDVSTLDTLSATCKNADTTTCTLPAGGSALTPSGQTVGWFLGDVTESNQSREVTIVFTAKVTASDATNTIGTVRPNTAKIAWNLTNKANPTSAGATFDKSPGSNTVNYTILEPATAITKAVSSATPAPGETFTYTVRASNPGGDNVSDAHNVVVKDVVPEGVVVKTSTITGGGTYVPATRTITWNIAVLTVAAPNFKEFTYDATLDESETLPGAALTNTATVTRYTSLPVIADGRTYTGPDAEKDVTPAFPHTKVVKTVVGSSVSYVDEPQNFRITVTSDGASPAYKIDVTDLLPKNWTLNRASATVKVGDDAAVPLPPSTDDEGNPQTVAWNDLAPDGLAVGKTIVINYTATPHEDALEDAGAGSGVDHTNTASINAEDATGATSSGKPTNPGYAGDPDDASAQIHEADLQIVKTGAATGIAGTEYTWNIAVTNNGGDPATGPIVVKDTKPANVSGFSLSGTGWTCSAAVNVWTCTTPGPLASGASAADLTATGTIDSDRAEDSTVTNTATVKGHTYDPDTDNNTSTKPVTVKAKADLVLDKRLSGAVGVTAGQNATWTIDVTNNGPSTSRADITVVDTLPADSTFVSAAGTGWECDEDDGVVTCVRDTDLPVTTAAPQITVVAKVSAAQTDDVENSAEVTGTTADPVEENNVDSVTTEPTRTTTLTIEKALAGDHPAVAGSNATYDMTVHNVGPSTATSVTTVDTLPSYMTYVGGGGNGWTCDADDQVVTCELTGSMAVNADSTYELTVDIDSAHTGDIVNSAEVTATEDPTGDTDIDTNTPDLDSDLEVEKSHTATAIAGASLEYTIRVTNHGPSDTDGPIVVEDTVPAGMTYKESSGAGWSCDEEDGVVTCTRTAGLVDGATSSFTLTFDIATTAGPASVTNVVTVDGPNADPEPTNNSDTDPTEIVDRANISVTKEASADTVNAGDSVSWSIVVTNDGPSTADTVVVTDTLPAGLTVTSISGTGWTCVKATVSCTRATLAPGEAEPITVVTKVGSGVVLDTELTNDVRISTATAGDDEDDNDADDTVFSTISADMILAKTHEGTPVAGRPFTFTLTATNDGPSNALAPITITDTLPVGMTYLSANDAWTCVPGPVSQLGQEVVCTLVSQADLVPGTDAAVLVMQVDVAADQSGVELTNEASVESDTPDPTPGNNVDDDSVTPTDEVDLSVVKTHTGPVEVGQQLTFQVDVNNAGPSEARDVKIADALPTGLTFVSASGTGWTCSTSAATCELDDPLAPGADAAPITVTVDVTPEAYPGVDNIAKASTSSNDTDDTNDESTDSVVVPPKVNLSVVKELTGTLLVGEQGTYTLSVHNDGPTADPGPVKVTDDLPAGLTFVSGTADGWGCAAQGKLVTCERDGALAVDATEVITLKVDVGAKAYPSVSNTAIVSTPSNDTDPGDNTSTVESPVDGSAVLTIDKSLDDQDGDTAVWSIVVTNEGPTETTKSIKVTDKLPKGLKFVSAKGDGWDCSAAGRTVTCDRDAPLAVGDSAEILVTTKITLDDGSEIVNVASVEGGNKAVDSGVLSDDATAVAPEADGLIPDTGGPALWLLLAGLLSVFGGGLLVSRRRAPKAQQSAGRHL